MGMLAIKKGDLFTLQAAYANFTNAVAKDRLENVQIRCTLKSDIDLVDNSVDELKKLYDFSVIRNACSFLSEDFKLCQIIINGVVVWEL